MMENHSDCRQLIKSLYAHAESLEFALPAFNYNDLWELEAIVQAAKAETAPVFAAASALAYRTLGIEMMAAIGRAAMAQHAGVFCHLDHARKLEECRAAVDAGFASVMIDGSALPFDENIWITRQVVEYAHARGKFVEGELGRLGGREVEAGNSGQSLVQVEEVVRFITETGVDSLAIAIGNAHGFYKAAPQLDFDRLQQVKGLTSIPLVLHGGTGIPQEELMKAIRLGIRKVNFGTIVHYHYAQGLRAALEQNPETTDIVHLFTSAIAPVVEAVREAIRACGASGKVKFLQGVHG
jgi:fructose-bisphosphate aldolase class II